MSFLSIGEINFLNCLPLFSLLKEESPEKDYHYIQGNPAQLNQMLATNHVDISPSSTMEYALRPEHYFILPQISIASMREVRSVLLLSKNPIESLTNTTIALTAQSLTSVYLLKIILFHFYRLDSRTINFITAEFNGNNTLPETALLIGDQALQVFHQTPPGYRVYDMGSLWYQFTNLPFVYALWIGRKEMEDEKLNHISELSTRLYRIKKVLPEHLATLLTAAGRRYPDIPEEAILKYWREAISYELNVREKQGLILFYTLAHQLGLLEKVPTLNFFHPGKPATG
jgi:chorismate dehydratase